MALTAQQEADVITLLGAFTNSKRLSELPNSVVGNPMDLIVEILDTDGESKQTKLAAMLPYLESTAAYGIKRDRTSLSPTWTRIGSTDLHKSLPIQNKMKGCLISDSATVVEYLSPLNWNAHVLDGSVGEVMVEKPGYWRKFEIDGVFDLAWFSEYPLPGYHYKKKKYISAYEAALQRSNGKLRSVVNMAADFRGGNNNAAYDGLNNSFLGRPVSLISRTALRAAARLGRTGTIGNFYDYDTHNEIYWLFMLEYATTNSQLPYNAALDVNGYKQGGLGNGVTDWDGTWNTFNGYYPFVPCGASNSLGNFSGEVVYNVKQTDNITTLKTVMVNRYRGIELPFGHIWKWLDGANIEVKTVADGGTSKLYVANTPADYNDSNYVGHTMRGLLARTSDYKKTAIMGQFGELEPSEVGGGSTTYYCDYFYCDVSVSTLRGIFVGGAAHDGAAAGFGCSGAHYAPSGALAYIGSRLLLIPA